MAEDNGTANIREVYDLVTGLRTHFDTRMDAAMLAIHAVEASVATKPCREHADAIDDQDNALRGIAREIRDQMAAQKGELQGEMRRKQIAWTAGGAGGTLAIIAGWLGFNKGG